MLLFFDLKSTIITLKESVCIVHCAVNTLIALSHGHCQIAPCYIAVGSSEEMATLPVHEKHSAEEV